RRRERGVAAVTRDEGVRNRSHALAAPPGGLLVGCDADRSADDLTGHVRRVAVAGLHAGTIVTRRHADDRLAARRFEHADDVGRDQRAPRKYAEVERLEV